MKKFFVVGCPRSGTTLLQRILNEHCQIVIPPETAFAELVTRSRRGQAAHWQRIKADLGIGLALPRRGLRGLADARDLYERMAHAYVQRVQRHGIAYFGEKTPQHQRYLSLLWRLFPEAKVVLVFRDGRDVAVSLSRQPWMSRDINVNFALWLHYASIQRRSEQARPLQLHAVQYESLVSAPETHVRKICEFLELDYQPTMLSQSREFAGVPDWEMPWKAAALRPITTDQIGQWRQVLSHDQLHRLEGWGGTALRRLGYTLSSEDRWRLPPIFLPLVYLKSLWWAATRVRFAEHRSAAMPAAEIAERKLAFYDHLRPTPVPIDRGRLARRWSPRAGRLLDIGCGPGNHLRHLAPNADTAIGVDVDLPILAIARRRIETPNVSLLRYDGTNLPFAASAFDVVTTLDVLEHVSDRRALVGEIARVLRPGGSWIVSVPHRGALRWLSPENLARDFPRCYRMLSRILCPQFWVCAQGASAQRHEHFTASELSALAASQFTLARVARRGGPAYAVAYLAASFPPPGGGKYWTSACFAAMAVDYEMPYGPLAYNLAIEFRRRAA